MNNILTEWDRMVFIWPFRLLLLFVWILFFKCDRCSRFQFSQNWQKKSQLNNKWKPIWKRIHFQHYTHHLLHVFLCGFYVRHYIFYLHWNDGNAFDLIVLNYLERNETFGMRTFHSILRFCIHVWLFLLFLHTKINWYSRLSIFFINPKKRHTYILVSYLEDINCIQCDCTDDRGTERERAKEGKRRRWKKRKENAFLCALYLYRSHSPSFSLFMRQFHIMRNNTNTNYRSAPLTVASISV